MIDILIVDDQILFAESLKQVLEGELDFNVVFVALHGQEALDYLQCHSVDIILMDVRMPIMDGIETVKQIREKDADTKIVMLTTFDDDDYVYQAIKFGANSYLLKDMVPEVFFESIRAVLTDNVMMSEKILKKITNRLTNGEYEKKDLKCAEKIGRLNPREKEILYLISCGKENNEIADIIFVGPQTVKNYISIIYTKLEVKNRVQAAKLAFEYGCDRLKDSIK